MSNLGHATVWKAYLTMNREEALGTNNSRIELV